MKKHHYTPCLGRIDSTYESRWSAIRAVTGAWYDIELDALGPRHESLTTLEMDRYSPSMQQWILFNEEIRNKTDLRVIRDDFIVEKINDPDSTSLQVISEGNVCWAVLNSHIHLDDPPVTRLTGDCHGDYDEDLHFANRWTLEWECNDTVTDFALDQIVFKLRGERGGCSVEVQETSSELLDAMTNYFQRSTWFGETCIFESPDVFATVRGRQLNLEIRGNLELSDLPGCITGNLNHGGAFHGVLIP